MVRTAEALLPEGPALINNQHRQGNTHHSSEDASDIQSDLALDIDHNDAPYRA